THTSGLPAWRLLYVIAEGTRDAAVAAIVNEKLEYSPGTRVVYSDLGFIALGVLLERMTGTGFVELARQELIEPLGLKVTFFNPGIGFRKLVAASEKGNIYEQQLREIEPSDSPVRSSVSRASVIWGQVH